MSLSVDIRKKFKGFHLDVRFESAGRPLGILGASGSGKSMTLKCIAGLETPDEGRIALNGRALFDSDRKINLKPQLRRVGYLFQSYALFPHMTVFQNLACAFRKPDIQRNDKIGALMRRFELSGLEGRYPGQLSGGQQQRVALARVLACEPEALLLDEPFSALDYHLKEALQLDMIKLLEAYPGDAVMVTHSRDEVYKLSRDLLVLEDGRKAALGSTREMFDRPSKLSVARLTGCKNLSKAKRIAQNRVEAVEWGCAFTVAGPISSAVTHVGIRAHYFYPCNDASRPNAFPVLPVQAVEGPFEWNVLLRCAAGPGDGKSIWWKYPKGSGPFQLPEYLAVAPEDILLLEA